MNPPLEDPWTIPPPLDRNGPGASPPNTGAQPPAFYNTPQPGYAPQPGHLPQPNPALQEYGAPQPGYQPQPGYPQYYDQSQPGQAPTGSMPQTVDPYGAIAQPQYPAHMQPLDNQQYQHMAYQQPQGPPGVGPIPPAWDQLAEESDTKSHVTIYAPRRAKPYLIGGALILLAVFGLSRIIGGGGDATTVAIDTEAEEIVDDGTVEETPEELAFDDLAERIDDLETTDDNDIIIIDDNNGYQGGYGGGCCGNGYGNGVGTGDNNGPGIVLDSDIDIQPGDDLVIIPDAEEPTIGDGQGSELVTHEFPSCNTIDDDGVGHDSDEGADSDNEPGAANVAFPFTDNFGLDSPTVWAPLSGAWGLTGEAYQQTEPDTYGNLTELKAELPDHYSVEVDITPLGDTIGGGFMLAQPTPGKRAGAVVVDLAENGSFVRFGHYDAETGDYNYDGGVSTPDGFDPALPHTFGIRAGAEKTVILLDGEPVGDFGPLEPGHLGLFTSLAASSFDNLKITAL